jgi:hypothetical protein
LVNRNDELEMTLNITCDIQSYHRNTNAEECFGTSAITGHKRQILCVLSFDPALHCNIFETFRTDLSRRVNHSLLSFRVDLWFVSSAGFD